MEFSRQRTYNARMKQIGLDNSFILRIIHNTSSRRAGKKMSKLAMRRKMVQNGF